MKRSAIPVVQQSFASGSKLLTALSLVLLALSCQGPGRSKAPVAAKPDTLEVLNRLIREDSSLAVLYFSRAQVHFSRGDTAAALRDAAQAMRIDSSTADYPTLLGYLQYLLGQDAAAERALTRALALGSPSPELRLHLGHVHLLQDRPELALRRYDEALALDDSVPMYHFSRAFCLQRMGRSGEARRAAERALALDSLHPKSLSFLFDLYMTAPTPGQLPSPAALEQARQLNLRQLRADSSFALAWFNQGLYYQYRYQQSPADGSPGRRGLLLFAIASYSQALQRSPTYAPAYYNRGYAYAELRRSEQALADFRKASQLQPGDARAWYMLGTEYERQALLTEALPCYRRALALQPDFRDARRALAQVEARLQRTP